MASAASSIDEHPRSLVVTDSYDYDAFGNEVNSTGSTPNNYLYRGEQLDPDLGLYYLRARYYNPLTGRFMSRDPNEPGPFDASGNPVDPKKLHKYLYVGGDPVNLIDPRGRDDEEEYGFLYTEIGATAEEIHKFIAGPVLCAFGVEAYVISKALLERLGFFAETVLLNWYRFDRIDEFRTDDLCNLFIDIFILPLTT